MNSTPHSRGGSARSGGVSASPASLARGSSSVGKNGTSRRQSPPRQSPRTGKLVALSVIIIAVWLGIAAVGGPQFGNLSNVATNDQSSFLPRSSESARVQEKIKAFGDQDRLPAIIVVEQSDGTPLDIPALSSVAQQLRDAAEGTTTRALSFHLITKPLLKWLFYFHPTVTRRMRWKTSHRL